MTSVLEKQNKAFGHRLVNNFKLSHDFSNPTDRWLTQMELMLKQEFAAMESDEAARMA